MAASLFGSPHKNKEMYDMTKKFASKKQLSMFTVLLGCFRYIYIPRRKSGIYWIQVRRAAAAVEISLWTR